MENILLGDKVSPHIFILSKKLKASAVEQFQAKGKTIIEYVPWIAAGAAVDFDFADTLLLPPTGVERGQLVQSPPYLEAAKAYVEQGLKRVPAHPGLLPGARADWVPAPVEGIDKTQAVADAVHLLKAANVGLAALYAELVEFVLPLGNVHRGYSNGDTRGILFRGFPAAWNKYDIAIDLVHELGHHSLYIWQSIDMILTTPLTEPIYSSVRKDFRPAIQSFHGAVALAFMLWLTQCWGRDPIALEVKHRHGTFYVGETLESALAEALSTLREKCQFTPVGIKMLAEMDSLLFAG